MGHPAERARTIPQLLRLLAPCRLCGEAMIPPPVLWARPHHRALLVGQAPGSVEAGVGLPFQGAAGKRLRGWLEPIGLSDPEAFLDAFAVCAVAKCYPGPHPGGRGDRVPTRAERQNCRPWTDATLRLLDPPLIVAVGRLAIADWIGNQPLVDIVGERFEADGRTVIPLPHPSGASAWANSLENRERIARAVALIGVELDALRGSASQAS
jgi:uracil-DNA glycosylase